MEEFKIYAPAEDGVPTLVLDYYGTQVSEEYAQQDQYTNPMHYGGKA